jgi:hypothetical protein
MSFTGYINSSLLSAIQEYTNFSYNGVAAKIPYFISANGVYGGKKTVAQIKAYISANKGSQNLQTFIDANKPNCKIFHVIYKKGCPILG